MSKLKRDVHGNVLFVRSPNVNYNTPLTATDARTIGEAYGPRGGIPGLAPAGQYERDNGQEDWAKYIITTPNATWIPNIADDPREVRIRVDGRFGSHDFSLWPQWYFDETRHLAFVPSKPSDLSNHPRAVLWHNLKTSDFDYEPGAVFTDLGKISNDLLETVMDVRRSLTTDIHKVLDSNAILVPMERYILEKSVVNMQLSSVCLTVAPQSFFATLTTFTLFQRHALEGLACFDLVTSWSDVKAMASGQFVAPLNVDKPVIGAITFRPQIAVELAALGVPVWLVRPPSAINVTSMKILDTTDPVKLSHTTLASTTKRDPYDVKFTGGPSPARNRACVCLRLGHLHLGAYAGLTSTQPSVNPVVTLAPPIPFNAMTPVRTDLPLLCNVNDFKAPGINVKKFEEPEVDAWPGVVPAWRQALKNCVRNWKLAYFHDDLTLIRGYALMDPYLIARSNRAGDLALVVWLFIRSPWISEVATRWNPREPFPSPQDWRTYVAYAGAKIGFVWGGGTAAVNAANKTLPSEIAAKFPLSLPQSPSLVNLYWRGQIVATADDLSSGRLPISDRIREEIIFDLYEQNFRIELLSLDRMQVFRGYMTEEMADRRDNFVTAVFPRNVIVTSNVAEECLGLRHTRLRAFHVNNLRRVMVGWGSVCASLQQPVFCTGAHSTDAEISKAETHIFLLYCNQFFKFFCRAPTIPHICPDPHL